MKSVLTPIFTLLFTNFIFATIWTVDNDTLSPGYPAQFNSIQIAHDYASSGDTLLVYPGNYFNLTVNKKITIIGPGFNPQGYNTNTVNIAFLYLDSVSSTQNAGNSKFLSLRIGVIDNLGASQHQIDSVTFERCYFFLNLTSHVLGNNWRFINNIFYWNSVGGSLNCNYNNNILISNNLFCSPNGTYQIINSNKATVFFFNNLFTGHYDGIAQFQNVSNCLFQNNIFFGKSPYQATNSDFFNNIFYGNIFSNYINPSSTGIANIVADPQFMNLPVDNSMYQCSFSHDYRLNPSSPGINNGTNSTDIGLFGGLFPMPLVNNAISGMPPLIYIGSIQINGNNFVPLGNNSLNISVTGVKNN